MLTFHLSVTYYFFGQLSVNYCFLAKYQLTANPVGTLISPSAVKRESFYRQSSKMQKKINLQKVSRYFKSHYFSWCSRIYIYMVPEESLHWKNKFLMFSKTLSRLDITRSYIWKYRQTFHKNSWTKPSEGLKFNLQPSIVKATTPLTSPS